MPVKNIAIIYPQWPCVHTLSLHPRHPYQSITVQENKLGACSGSTRDLGPLTFWRWWSLLAPPFFICFRRLCICYMFLLATLLACKAGQKMTIITLMRFRRFEMSRPFEFLLTNILCSAGADVVLEDFDLQYSNISGSNLNIRPNNNHCIR